MAKGCLAALFGIGLKPSAGDTRSGSSVGGNAQPRPTSGGMSEGDIHSGPGGYEGMGYSGGYAADYRAKHKSEPADSAPESANAEADDTHDLSSEEAEDYGFEEGEA